MFYVEFLVDDEPYELELRPGMVFTKCAKCGQKIYGHFHLGGGREMLCDECAPPLPDPKKKLIARSFQLLVVYKTGIAIFLS